MSNQDSFIDEVSEAVRRDRLFKAFRRYGWIGILAIVVLVGGASFNEWRKATARSEAEAAGSALLRALEISDPAERSAALVAVDAGENAARSAILALAQSDAELDAGDRTAAIATLRALADNTAAPQPYRDVATLKAAILSVGVTPPEERIATLNTLALSGSAFRLLANEQIALAEIELGQTDAAQARLREIVEDASVTGDLRRRASQLIVAMGGSLTGG